MTERRRRGVVYRAAVFLTGVVFRWICRGEILGREHVPRSGACLIVSNHASFLDPPFLALVCSHQDLRFLARSTLLKVPGMAWFYRAVKVIPLDRDRGDIAAIKAVLHALHQNDPVALFPEGTRTQDGKLQPAKRGIGFLIARAGVPVLPVYIDGTFDVLPRTAKWLRPHKVRVFCGLPLLPSDWAVLGDGKESYEAIASLVMARIAALQPPERMDGGARA